MRTLIIGDIHGCIRELEELIKEFSPTSHDRIYCVGDIISRGEKYQYFLTYCKAIGTLSVQNNDNRLNIINTINAKMTLLLLSKRYFSLKLPSSTHSIINSIEKKTIPALERGNINAYVTIRALIY